MYFTILLLQLHDQTFMLLIFGNPFIPSIILIVVYVFNVEKKGEQSLHRINVCFTEYSARSNQH